MEQREIERDRPGRERGDGREVVARVAEEWKKRKEREIGEQGRGREENQERRGRGWCMRRG